MSEHDLAVVSGATVRRVLEGREDLVLSAVSDAYLAHAEGKASSPHTEPLFAGGGRFFAMPASLEDTQPIVGVKWVSSFVANLTAGNERASALLIVNDAITGRPKAIVDGTLISAKRTAASAAIALRHMAPGDTLGCLAFVGCGPINYEIYRFIAHQFRVRRLLAVDVDSTRAEAFLRRVSRDFGVADAAAVTLEEALAEADVVSIATNTSAPHIAALPSRPMIVLHVSLRDLAPAVVTHSYNIVDDVEHVCSAKTSLHLAAEETGHRDFIHGTIPELISGALQYERQRVPSVVSPFGMAILDLALLRAVLAQLDETTDLTRVSNFRGSVWQ